MKIFLATFALLFASSAFGAQNLTGHWAIHNNIAGNENDVQCELVVTDNKITGSCKSQDKNLPLTGAANGNKFPWKFKANNNASRIPSSIRQTWMTQTRLWDLSKYSPTALLATLPLPEVQRLRSLAMQPLDNPA